MATLTRPWPTRKARGRALYSVVTPLLAGGTMLGASLLPWLIDPLGRALPAWHLPVDIGWQLHSTLFSYGLLCLLCSLYAFFISYLTHKTILPPPRRDSGLPLSASPSASPKGRYNKPVGTGVSSANDAGHQNEEPLSVLTSHACSDVLPQTGQTSSPYDSQIPTPESHPPSLPTQPNHTALRTHSTLAGLLCLMPICLFFTQYLFIDMNSIAQLAQHEFQALFIQKHFGYRIAAPFIPIRPDTFDPSTLNGRLTLLLDQIQPGLYLPFLGTFCLIGKGLTPSPQRRPVGTGVSSANDAGHQNRRDRAFPCPPLSAPAYHALPVRTDRPGRFPNPKIPTPERLALFRTPLPLIICFILLLMVLGRGPAALACRFQAKHLLFTGDYANALIWFDRASMLNPSLEQLSTYHTERGQALYYLYPTQHSLESQAYLAGFYLTQEDYLSAYQELTAARQQNMRAPTPSWLINELDITLTRLAEMQHPLSGPPALRAHRDLPSITWLNRLIHIDPSNVYAHYTLGRIKYDIYDFTACEKQMLSVINLSSNPNILSSAYTYLSLSSEAQGNYVQARDYLFKAQDLDPSHRNNTAREEMSGLH
jgi:hypothetical protein